MKQLLLSIATLYAVNLSAQVQTASEFVAPNADFSAAEVAPNIDNTPIEGSKALWNVQFSTNISASSGAVGQAAVAYFNNEFWTSMWASDTIIRYSNTGAFISKFTIPGVTGTRSITTDGTNLYIGANTNTIYVVDPGTQTLSSTITSAASVTSRFLTYDPTLDGGAGGFWTGNFGTDIVAISMTGSVLSSIAAATHTLTGMYGAAVDNVNAGGPYLWVFHQAGANNSQITVLNLTTGLPTLNTHDAFPDLSTTYSLATGLAGGAFFTTAYAGGQPSLVGLCQGDPANVIVIYDALMSGAGLEENELSNTLVYPVPATDEITVEFTEALSANGTATLVDMNGRIVLTQEVAKGTAKVSLVLNSVQAGTYVLNVATPSSNMVRTIEVQ